MKNFTYHFAKTISTLFVPPSFTFLIFLYLGLTLPVDLESSLQIILSGFILGLIFPILFFLFLMKKGKVGDADATIKEQRTIPYSFGIIISLFAILFTIWLRLDHLIIYMWIVYFLNMIALISINKYWKISAHALGAATPVGLLIFMHGFLGFLFLPLAAIVFWSRILLKKHTIGQVIAGGILGFLLSFGTLNLISKIF